MAHRSGNTSNGSVTLPPLQPPAARRLPTKDIPPPMSKTGSINSITSAPRHKVQHRGADLDHKYWRRTLRDLLDMRSQDGHLGERGVRLTGMMRERMARVMVQDALADGGLEEVRSAIHLASRVQGGQLPLKDPWIAHARTQLAQAEKCERECRDGLERQDMVLVQEAVDRARHIKLGPRMWDEPHLHKSKEHIDHWRKYKPYLQKLHVFHARLEDIGRKGLRYYCQYWAEVVDGEQLSQDYENAATVQLAMHAGARQALIQVLHEDQCRLLYDVPWSERGRLLTAIRFQLSRLGFDVHQLHFYAAPGHLTAIVIRGREEAVQEVLDATAGTGEPVALGHEAQRETSEEKHSRIARLLAKLDVALEKVQNSDSLADEGSTGFVMSKTVSFAPDSNRRNRRHSTGASGISLRGSQLSTSRRMSGIHGSCSGSLLGSPTAAACSCSSPAISVTRSPTSVSTPPQPAQVPSAIISDHHPDGQPTIERSYLECLYKAVSLANQANRSSTALDDEPAGSSPPSSVQPPEAAHTPKMDSMQQEMALCSTVGVGNADAQEGRALLNQLYGRLSARMAHSEMPHPSAADSSHGLVD